ncbi:hypothetical protein C2845_PM09G00770 [Panicum miliaceum]|uniref:Uncharacterized protein n=1 Tax=Panicum miliaceum TaxID=4540 RepID=A0A3L6S0W7_PANMI|nr:hypothetical protein C2845_PM09G00770 [Panicum miliaceum]
MAGGGVWRQARLGCLVDYWGSLVFFLLDDLDSVTEPPRWSPVPELDGAVFISGVDEGQTIFEDRHRRWVPREMGREKRPCHLHRP